MPICTIVQYRKLHKAYTKQNDNQNAYQAYHMWVQYDRKLSILHTHTYYTPVSTTVFGYECVL